MSAQVSGRYSLVYNAFINATEPATIVYGDPQTDAYEMLYCNASITPRLYDEHENLVAACVGLCPATPVPTPSFTYEYMNCSGQRIKLYESLEDACVGEDACV